ncbi:hypothetical protein TNCV_4866631 [Trichonephila clavipes]|nr:hypothetical protein TNCV_4866631 [Trichonephila clavipes]
MQTHLQDNQILGNIEDHLDQSVSKESSRTRLAGACSKEPGRLFINPPSSSPESSSEKGAVGFSCGCVTVTLALILSSDSNKSVST